MRANNLLGQLPEKAYSVKQTKQFEQRAIEQGLSAAILMERAGEGAAVCMNTHFKGAKRLVIVCGTGNNAGDGFVLARLMRTNSAAEVSVVQVGELDDGKASPELITNRNKVIDLGIKIEPLSNLAKLSEDADLIIDAILGTGARAPLSSELITAIDTINNSNRSVLSLDMPSGLDGDTGAVLGSAVVASTTLTFVTMKQGLLLGQGLEHSGELLYFDLRVPPLVFEGEKPELTCITKEIITLVPKRNRVAHKGDFGHTLVIGGWDEWSVGALCLATLASLRSGSGLTSSLCPRALLGMLRQLPMEAMAHGMESLDDAKLAIEKASHLVVGPGLGQSEQAQTVLALALDSNKPCVLDADALNLLSKKPINVSQAILTPHPKEAARLLSVETKDVQANRFKAARQIASDYKAVVVLKGAGTIVSSEERAVILPIANPMMAKGGMGDVLAGMCGAWLAQGLGAFDAACLAVAIHGFNADILSKSFGHGLMPSDVAQIGPFGYR